MPITKYERRILKTSELVKNNAIGYDYECQFLRPGDPVAVIQEESERKAFPEYKFCGIGKKGKVIRNGDVDGFMHWFIIVEFIQEDGTTTEVMCTDFFLRKI